MADLTFGIMDVLERLATLERHIVIYVVGFIVIRMYGINHHIQFHFVARVSRRLTGLNLGHLLPASFLPFATDPIGGHEKTRFMPGPVDNRLGVRAPEGA